jgi:hypothetical protein
VSFRNLKEDPSAYFAFVRDMMNVVEYGSVSLKLEFIVELIEFEQEDLLEDFQDRMGIEQYYKIIPLC